MTQVIITREDKVRAVGRIMQVFAERNGGRHISSKQIAELLRVSRRTARYYMRDARVMLGEDLSPLDEAILYDRANGR